MKVRLKQSKGDRKSGKDKDFKEGKDGMNYEWKG